LITPTTITNIATALEQFMPSRAGDDSDDNQSMVTVVPGNNNNNNNHHHEDDILYLNSSTDPSDYFNANSTPQTRTLETIVEVVNPILVGDGIAQEIAVGRVANDDLSLPSFNVDDDDEEELELSLSDKMKNVLKELRENEKVRLSWSRSMEDESLKEQEDGDVEMPEASGSYEEKTGSIGTVFMVRERLINDFYDHEDAVNQEENIDNCQVFSNPNVDEFLAHEIQHAQATTVIPVTTIERESLTLDLTKTINDDSNDEEDDTNTPTTPTKALDANVPAAAGNKKRRRNKKNKAKK
jgi:hypothetical protein